MPKILIVIHTNTFFVELFRLAKLLQASGNYELALLFPYRYPTYADDILRCMENQFSCYDITGQHITDIGGSGYSETPVGTGENKEHQPRIPFGILNRLKAAYRKANHFLGYSGLIRVVREYRYFQERYDFVRRVIAEQGPSLLILGGDMVGYDTSVFVQVAHQKKIPVAIVPSTMSNGLEQAEAYFHNSQHNLGILINRIAARLYPKWVKEHRGRKLLRVPGERVMAMEYLKLAPPLPWVFNSGFADAIAIESEQMKKYYLECGLPEGRLKLTGSPADDVMADILHQKEKYRAQLCEELGLDPRKPILLSALPPDFLYLVGGRPECDFAVYPDLVEFWVRTVARAKNYNIVFCLHPSVKYEDYQYIEKWGCKVSRQGTADLIPLCDIYVASVSSTIRWALACGVPVINYDVYRYHYTDFVAASGVLIVEEQADFEAVLDTLTRNVDYYARIKLKQADEARRWGCLDGKTGERLQNLFVSLIAQNTELS